MLLNIFLDKIKDDDDLMLVAVKASGYFVEHASKRLKDDRNFILTAFGISCEWHTFCLRTIKR